MGLFSNNAAKEAEKTAARQEAQRQDRVATNVGAIDRAYGNREPQYADFGAALRQQYGDEIARQQTKAARLLKFSVARGGLTGGSADIDLNGELRGEGARAAINAERRTQQAVGGLRSADETVRLNQISLAQNGSDVGNAALQSANALRANLDSAKGAANVQNLGDVFANTADVFKTQQAAAQRRKGLNEADIYANQGKP